MLAPELDNANRQIIVYVTFLHSMGEDPDELDGTTTREKDDLKMNQFMVYSETSSLTHRKNPSHPQNWLTLFAVI